MQPLQNSQPLANYPPPLSARAPSQNELFIGSAGVLLPLNFSKTELISLASHLRLKLSSGEAKHIFKEANECAHEATLKSL